MLPIRLTYTPGGPKMAITGNECLSAGALYAGCRFYAGYPITPSSENLEWMEDWDEDRLDIPLAVKMTISWQNENVENFFWRTAGNGYYERYGAWRNGEKINR